MTVRTHEIKSRDEWLKWRRRNINGTQQAGIMGLAKYSSPLQVWHDVHGTAPAREETDLMLWGTLFEDANLARLRQKHPDWRIEKQSVYYEDTNLRIGATPDAFAWRPDRDGKGLIELKTVAGLVFDEDWFDGNGRIVPPVDYQIQVLQTAKLTGCTWAQIVPLVLSDFRRDHEEIPVPLDEDAWAGCLKVTKAFWERVAAGGPVPDALAQDDELIKALYPTEDGSVIDLSGDNELPGLIAEFEALGEAISLANKTAKASIKPMEEQKKTLRNQIKAKVGAATTAIAGMKEVTCKTVQVQAYSYRDLRIKDRRAA